MTAFQRLSATPTVPDLLRREADRRAARSSRALPEAAWCRSATVAVAWDHGLNGRLFQEGRLFKDGRLSKPGPVRLPRGGTAPVRSAADLAHARAASRGRAVQRPMQTRSNAIARSRRAALQAGPAHTLRSWRCQAGMTLCFASASGVLAATQVLNWCRLLSPAGIDTALAGADRLTRAGMRLWRTGRTARRT